MHDVTVDLGPAVWAIAEGRATAQERAVLEAEPAAFARTLRRLIQETEDHLASVRT